jgi:hypothetical protein
MVSNDLNGLRKKAIKKNKNQSGRTLPWRPGPCASRSYMHRAALFKKNKTLSLILEEKTTK